MKKLCLVVYIVCLAIWPMGYGALNASAATEMEIGVALFNRRDYKNALNHFVVTLRKNPSDCNALYYEALTLHHMNELDLAKHTYKIIIQRFPNTPQAQNAAKVLAYIDPVYYKSSMQQIARAQATSGSTGSNETTPQTGASADWASLPAQARIPYQREGQNLIITAFVNGRPIEMFFDSGAEGVVMRKSELEALGIRAPEGQHVGISYGVGDGGGQKTWAAQVTLKVGQIERRNFTVHVQEDPPGGGPGHPLLGQSFFRDFSYTLDPAPDQNSGSILFQKKGVTFTRNDSSVIPFRNMGKDILVNVLVNSRPATMIFDTGAENCCFTLRQLEALGISIPEDASQGTDSGIAGTTKSWRFNIGRMQLGPIIKSDVPVSVIEASGIPYPLLGNSFLRDLRMDIDNSAHQMRVRR